MSSLEKMLEDIRQRKERTVEASQKILQVSSEMNLTVAEFEEAIKLTKEIAYLSAIPNSSKKQGEDRCIAWRSNTRKHYCNVYYWPYPQL